MKKLIILSIALCLILGGCGVKDLREEIELGKEVTQKCVNEGGNPVCQTAENFLNKLTSCYCLFKEE